MIQSIIDFLISLTKKSKSVPTLENEELGQSDEFHVIPLYSEEEMRCAEETSDENIIGGYLYRQALNGYVGIFNNQWLVGRGMNGQLVKAPLKSLAQTICNPEDKVKRTQSHAKYGCELKGKVYCKLSYDLCDCELFSTHVCLEREYVEGEIYEDCGNYGGLHFSDIEHFEACLEHRYTFYGNKIIIVEPLNECVYYNYMDNVYVGNKIEVKRVLYMDTIETWKQLVQLHKNIIIDKRDCILNYLEDLSKIDTKRNYQEVISYISQKH